LKKLLKESYEWIKTPDELPKENLLKVTAKTTAKTEHPEDENYPVRIFPEKELELAARSLKYKPVGLNHEFIIEEAIVLDSEWNAKEQAVEALLYVPDEYIKKVAEGKIDHVSVEYTWRNEVAEDGGIAFYGLNFDRVDLVEGLEAGDAGATVKLFEAKDKKGKFLGEIVKCKICEKKLTEPFADYADFDDCVRKNQDKEDPEAYCGSIKAKVEQGDEEPEQHECPEGEMWDEEQQKCVKKAEEQHECPEGEEWSEEEQKCVKKAEEQDDEEPEKDEHGCIKDKEVWDEEQEKCVPKPEEPTAEELKEALKRIMKAHKELKESINRKVEEATVKERDKILEIVESTIPCAMVTSRFNLGAKRFVWELKKAIRAVREE